MHKAPSQGDFYVDIRVRVHVSLEIGNVHAIEIPVRDFHRCECIFDFVLLSFYAIAEKRNKKLTYIATDGARNMSERQESAAKSFEGMCLQGFNRI